MNLPAREDPAALALGGRRIAVTRPREQAEGFADLLRRLGAEVVMAPLIAIEDPPEPKALRTLVPQADGFDWLVFTSANAVERFWSEMDSLGRDAPTLGSVAICAVGSATARAVEKHGARVSLVPEEFVGEGVVDALARAGDLRGRRILFVRAEGARPLIPEALRALGADVVEVTAYRTVIDRGSADTLRARIRGDRLDVVTLTSSSAVQGLVEAIGTDLGSALIATIGPVTSSTARAAGLRVDIEADPYTTEGLATKIVEYYAGRAPEATRRAPS